MSKKVKDVIGKRYNMLVILDIKREKGKTYYYCRCDCGNEKWIRADSITSEKQKSCGCLSKLTQIQSKDITGIKYSMLTPVEYTGVGKGENEVWLCRCDCGNEVEVLKKNIYSTSKKSCGCRAAKQKIEASKSGQEKLKEIDWVEGTSLSNISREKPIMSNSSGITGVKWDKDRRKWVAEIEFKGKRHYLGRYENKEDAAKVRKEAEEEYFKPIIEKYEKN